MTELTEKAENYAAEKTNQVMAKAIAQAFADGYRAGYNDCKEEILVDLRDTRIDYVDLGLPSGTLWSTDYEKDGDDNLYLSYEMASAKNLPTREQWRELKGICKWEYIGVKLEKIKCVGPNGNCIYFCPTGYLDFVRKVLDDEVYFWTKEEDERLAVRMWHYKYGREAIERQSYSDKLPIRLVK